MAGAILEGLLAKNVIPPKDICVCEIMKERREQLSKLGVSVTDDASKMLAASKAVIIAVKPNIVPSAVLNITSYENENDPTDQLFISICAGVELSALMSGNDQRRCVRVMPNVPCLVGAAASAYALGPTCTPDDEEEVKFIMGSCGTIVKVAEGHLNAVTGLSGSGPAYVFMMIEAMTDGGVRNGLPRSVAQSLAVQTVYGAAKMMIEDPTAHPAQLRNRVESPGGTTIAASQALEENSFRGAVMRAVDASAQRAAEMGPKK